ncbi:hypothetical protein COC64_25485 [Bacillus cereus]|uniref:hypothetical protein n=1 Tax=Bacillus cereus TaxID=1396 RepID=UPI000BFC33E4|nr:hypothetical protein [Bacillus cereus]PGR32139.1 hypothetical protein COC64_25485 [Bacillus cereus]
MTLVVAWVGVDTKGPGSAYIASDSRISWGNGNYFDYARKVFAFNDYPDILGYCGDVMFPTIVISQIIEMGDKGLLFKDNFTCKEKFEVIKGTLKNAFFKYPNDVKYITSDSLQVIHISREPTDNKKFVCHLMTWNRQDGWSYEEILFPKQSVLILVMGSGKKEFNEKYKIYQKGDNEGTSRNVFHCFCDTLFNIEDTYCGGAPQLVGLYRKPKSTALRFGIIKDKKRYLFGAEIDNPINFDMIEWRNEFFELCDGKTMLKLKGAQHQPNRLRKS